MTAPDQPLDAYGTMMLTYEAAMKLREQLRGALRALEEGYGLPHSFQTWRERNPYSARGGGHVKKDEG
jgi:hypothetical protein